MKIDLQPRDKEILNTKYTSNNQRKLGREVDVALERDGKKVGQAVDTGPLVKPVIHEYLSSEGFNQ